MTQRLDNQFITQLIDHSMSTANLARASHQAPGNHDALDKTAQDFQAVFLTEVLNHMFKEIEVDPLFGGGSAESLFRSVLLEKYSDILSQNDMLKLNSLVKQELLKLQEVTSHEDIQS